MDWITQPEAWIAFLTLVALELVLGVDNVIFISILAGKLPVDQQPRARTTGIALAVITRILLLLSISWVIGLTEPLFSVFSIDFVNVCSAFASTSSGKCSAFSSSGLIMKKSVWAMVSCQLLVE